MSRSTRISYVIMAVALVLIGWLHLGMLVLTSLFGYFALEKLSLGKSKSLGVILYIAAVAGASYGLYKFSRQAYRELPSIAERSIPATVDYAQSQGIQLPFSDFKSLKETAIEEFKDKVANVGRYLRTAVYEIAQLIIGLVVAVSLFINVRWGTENDPQTSHDSLYATVVRELATRFQTFFASFSRVIGAQITISIINTGMTSVFLLAANYPYKSVIVVLTFLCGLLPIIGNIISNTLIVAVGFTLSPRVALFALIFLVAIHKLEYFLNSKIIGDRIKNPMWLTLIGIVLGEKLMGIPGMILAPVVLHYIKVEASKNKIKEESAASAADSKSG